MPVMLSLEDYEGFAALEDAWWVARAEDAEKDDDWLGLADSEKYMRDVLGAKE